MEKGYFIVLEGGEGSGKSTAAQFLQKAFEDKGYEVVLTREPGGVESAEDIRGVIMNHEMNSWTEALLFAAARNEHLQEKVKPALAEGKVVICDRFVHSSLAYQGYAGGMGIERVMELNRSFFEDCRPDMVLFLDLSPEEGLKRIQENNRETNRMDEKGLVYHERVYQGYQRAMQLYPMTRIPADISLAKLESEMNLIATHYFPEKTVV